MNAEPAKNLTAQKRGGKLGASEMTPLMKRMLKSISEIKLGEQSKRDMSFFYSGLSCFRVDEIMRPLIAGLTGREGADAINSVKYPFVMPSNFVALEWDDPEGEYNELTGRGCFIVGKVVDDDYLTLSMLIDQVKTPMEIAQIHPPKTKEGVWSVAIRSDLMSRESTQNEACWAATHAIMMIDIIQNNDLVTKREVPIHKGLAKIVKRKFGTEIIGVTIININKKGIRSDGASHSSTAPKCFHFVRSHRRKLQDREVIVSAHWRGDPEVGYKKPNYKLVS